MKRLTTIFIAVLCLGCTSVLKVDIPQYFETVNQAELEICSGDYQKSVNLYKSAFEKIEKPFGKDVFNAALAAQLSDDIEDRNVFLQIIMDNSNELKWVESKFVGQYMSAAEWNTLLSKQNIAYQPNLRQEMKDINKRDQLFRPMYDTHDDTINANRKINMYRIMELTKDNGFPAQMELGYTEDLRLQNHYIVLHHSAQRRSYDKSVIDLEPVLKKAVEAGRFDPEIAIYYLSFQSDHDKGPFEVFGTWQYKHPLLSRELNNKRWLPKLDEQQKALVNEVRKAWMANSLDDIAEKSTFLAKSKLPFIFTSVHKYTMKIDESVDEQSALTQYELLTMNRVEAQ